jgi:formylglycine-generating enzyme required for sulfatase activity
VLYEMLAGEPPFTGPSAQAIVARIIVDAPRPIRTVRPNVPPHIQDALLRGLAKVPADRPASVKAFIDTLARPTQEYTAARPWWRRRTLLIGVVVVAMLVTAGVLVRRFTSGPKPVVRPAGMVLVPAGHYAVGGVVDRPANSVALDSFYIDSTEVTVAAYQQFLDSTGGTAPWRGTPPVDWPATGILWSEARQFCDWRGAALPTEDQWVAAARGPKGWRYPWGDTWDRGRANAASVADTLKAVGGFPLGRSFAGAVDLVGNAWEWVATEVATPRGAVRHIIKGGAFNTQPGSATASNRIAYPDDRQALWLTGFRCAKPATPRR